MPSTAISLLEHYGGGGGASKPGQQDDLLEDHAGPLHGQTSLL